MLCRIYRLVLVKNLCEVISFTKTDSGERNEGANVFLKRLVGLFSPSSPRTHSDRRVEDEHVPVGRDKTADCISVSVVLDEKC
jgi:hypothetical protein